MKFEEWESISPQTIFVSATPGPYEAEHAGQVVEQVVRPTGLLDPEIEVRPASTQVDDLLSEIRLRTAVGERVLVTVLTKRMAEDLTEYFDEHGIRVRYLHSDIDTVERVEIIRDLRLGKFDVLVGINLLREGLDIPEVSLVAILDADKEGFLRAERSLIQTIGRAARNAHGKAILYGDRITDSMRKAMDETARRREKQQAHNEKHGITPTTVTRSVADIMEAAQAPGKKSSRRRGNERKVAEPDAVYEPRSMHPDDVASAISKLEDGMFEAAQNLDFEEAARLRDRLHELKEKQLALG